MAKGVVYLLVGGLTLATVLGFSVGSGGVEGPQSILKWLSDQTFGQTLVGALGVGLLAYALWRFYRGFFDPRAKDHEPKSAVKRVSYVISGLINGALGVLALRLAFSSSSSEGGSKSKSIIASILDWPAGPFIVIAMGVIVIGVGAYQAYKGYKAEFVTDIQWRHLSRRAIKRIGRFGFFARAVVFAIIGYFLILAGSNSDASQFRSTEGALEYLSQHSGGIWLIGIVSLGLLLYGVFAFLKGYDGSIAAGEGGGFRQNSTHGHHFSESCLRSAFGACRL